MASGLKFSPEWYDERQRRNLPKGSQLATRAAVVPPVALAPAAPTKPAGKSALEKETARADRERAEREFAQQVALAKLPPPVEQHRFHETRGWRLDFAWPERKLAVEVQGGIWRKYKVKRKDGEVVDLPGAHALPSNIERDIEKHNALTLQGWALILVTPKMIRAGEALNLVEEMLGREA